MPELAEVEYFRKQWNPGLGQPILEVKIHPKARIFRKVVPIEQLERLTGTTFRASLAHGKQLLFEMASKEYTGWLAIHLGMSGALRIEAADFSPGKHDHLVLRQEGRALVLADFRLFGLVDLHFGPVPPDWWQTLPLGLLSPEYTAEKMRLFLKKHARAPLKAVLLNQDGFPGIGNWMADEILWRAALHPATEAGKLTALQEQALWLTIREVCKEALEVIGTDWSEPPETWLFPHRWKKGGLCPRTGVALKYEKIGGRTTCWSPGRQQL
jgi:formamidopyrimidine-DNA glycosylase